MQFTRYPSIQGFSADALDILMRNEEQNNIPIGFIMRGPQTNTSGWLLATVRDGTGAVRLTAACTPPFNLVLYETDNQPCAEALQLLSRELKTIGFAVPGVLAEQDLAARFAAIHAGAGNFSLHLSMHIMRLDKKPAVPNVPGRLRELQAGDLFFKPYWNHAFQIECHTEVQDLATHAAAMRDTLGQGLHYIWEDVAGQPVSQVSQTRGTPGGGVINYVYTPPYFRGKGYAGAAVVALSRLLLEQHGKQFCSLFADAENPISCGLYRKLGYRDICIFDELRFAQPM